MDDRSSWAWLERTPDTIELFLTAGSDAESSGPGGRVSLTRDEIDLIRYVGHDETPYFVLWGVLFTLNDDLNLDRGEPSGSGALGGETPDGEDFFS
ncbi:hypothetical protein [Haloferula sargassicola]